MSPTERELQHWTAMVERYGPAIDACAESFRRFVSLIDQVKALETIDFLKQLDVLLIELYLATRRLPEVDDWYPEDDDDEDERADDADFVDWSVVRERRTDMNRYYSRVQPILSRKFAAVDAYWEVFDPYGHLATSRITVGQDERLIALLSDDLGDIYEESRWLDGYESGDVARIQESAWQWRESTDRHTGEHFTGAMRAVRALIYDHEELWCDHDTYWETLA